MRVLVTGSTGGIGGAVAAEARLRGHDVETLDRAAFDAASASGDVALPRQLDALVFCTGTCPVRPVALTSDALFEETVRANCGLFLSLMRQIVANRLYSPGGFRAVALSSVSATEGWPGGAAYCASKGALSALCRAMDAELAPKKISVTALEPRWVKTRMFDETAGRMGADPSRARDPKDLAVEIINILERNEQK